MTYESKCPLCEAGSHEHRRDKRLAAFCLSRYCHQLAAREAWPAEKTEQEAHGRQRLVGRDASQLFQPFQPFTNLRADARHGQLGLNQL